MPARNAVSAAAKCACGGVQIETMIPEPVEVTADPDGPLAAFVEAKREPGRLRMFNLSVLVTDAFMQAVKEDAELRGAVQRGELIQFADAVDRARSAEGALDGRVHGVHGQPDFRGDLLDYLPASGGGFIFGQITLRSPPTPS